jgi:hypothetical protein
MEQCSESAAAHATFIRSSRQGQQHYSARWKVSAMRALIMQADWLAKRS